MGRDKPKKYDKMSYFQKEQWKRDEAEKRGIAGETYTDFRGNTQTRVNEKALKESIRNDFDYRTSAQHMDGAKGNGKFNDFTNYERAAVKLHKQAGNEGSYSSTKDITGVTNNLVNDYNNSIADKLDRVTNDINGMRDEIETRRGVQEQTTVDPQSFEHSDAVSKAQDNLEKYKLNIGVPDGLFAKSNDPAPRADDQSDATQSFADQYKMDVSDASDLGEVKARNLNNAIATVKSYRQ